MPVDLTAVGKEYFDGLLALVPDDKRAEAQSLYSRSQDQWRSGLQELQGKDQTLEQWHAKLKAWSADREAYFAERERTLGTKPNPANPNPNPNPQPPVNPNPANPAQPTAGMTREEVDAYLADRFEHFGRMVVGANSEQTLLQQRHQALYKGEKLFNPIELYTHPLAKTAGLTAAFEEIHKDTIAAAAAAAQKAAEDKIRADERQKLLAELGNSKTLPFPTPGEDDSPFAILERRTADNKERYGADAATEFYRQLKAGVSA